MRNTRESAQNWLSSKSEYSDKKSHSKRGHQDAYGSYEGVNWDDNSLHIS